MDFEYTPEQNQLRKAVREFAEGEIAPHVMEWDEAQIFPLDVIRKLGQLGYLGVIFPEDLGGAGLGYIDYSIVIEELSRVDGSVGIIVAAHTSLCGNHIYKVGTQDQRERYLTKLATGEWIGCWSLTEPEAGSDAAGTRTKAASICLACRVITSILRSGASGRRSGPGVRPGNDSSGVICGAAGGSAPRAEPRCASSHIELTSAPRAIKSAARRWTL